VLCASSVLTKLTVYAQMPDHCMAINVYDIAAYEQL